MQVEDALTHAYFDGLGPPLESAASEQLFNWDFEERAVSLEELQAGFGFVLVTRDLAFEENLFDSV